MDMSFLKMLEHGGIVIVVLLICSVISITVIIERLKVFYGIRPKVLEQVKARVRSLIMAGKISDAVAYCDTFEAKWFFFRTLCPLTTVLKTIIFSHKMDKESLSELANRTVDKELVALEKNLGIVGTIGNTSLYIGLFGTVLGIINAFGAISQQSAMGASVVSKGISEALVNTAAGLFVAVISVVFYNYFMRSVREVTVYLDDTAAEFIDLIKK